MNSSLSIGYAMLGFCWVVVGCAKPAHYESSVIVSLVPEVPRYWCLGDLPITHPSRALVLVELHSSLGEGLAEVFEAFVGNFGGHNERDVIHVPSNVDTSSTVDHHLGIPRYMSAEVFFGVLHEQ